MIYHYYCKQCGKKIDENFKMGEAVDSIECQCGGKMVQDILNKKIQTHLPEDFIAVSNYHSVDYGDDDVVEYKCGNN